MEITKQWLKKHIACQEAVEWYSLQKNKDTQAILNAIIREKKPLDWFNWYLSRRLPKIKRVQYAVFAARQVLRIFEDKYPDDKRPREAIEAAEKYIKNPTNKNKDAADAADAAADAADAAYAADAADAADAAAYAAYAAYAADAAADAAYAAADEAARRKVLIKILRYGLKLLEKSS